MFWVFNSTGFAVPGCFTFLMQPLFMDTSRLPLHSSWTHSSSIWREQFEFTSWCYEVEQFQTRHRNSVPTILAVSNSACTVVDYPVPDPDTNPKPESIHHLDPSWTQPSYQDNLAALQKHDKSLAWYKERYRSAEFKYQKLAEQKHTEDELREKLKKMHEIINSERDRAVAAEQTLSRQPSIFPSLNRGSGRGAGTGRPWTPEFEDMAIMLLATGLFLGHSRGELRSFAHAAHARYNDAQSHTQAHGHTLTYPHQSCTRVHGHTPHTSTPVTCRFVSSSHLQQYGHIAIVPWR